MPKEIFVNWSDIDDTGRKYTVWFAERRLIRNGNQIDPNETIQVVIKREDLNQAKFSRRIGEFSKKLLRRELGRSAQLIAMVQAGAANHVMGEMKNTYPGWYPIELYKGDNILDEAKFDDFKLSATDKIRDDGFEKSFWEDPSKIVILLIGDRVHDLLNPSRKNDSAEQASLLSQLNGDRAWKTLGSTLAVDWFFQNSDRADPFDTGSRNAVTLANVFFSGGTCLGGLDHFHTAGEGTWLNLYQKDADFENIEQLDNESIWMGTILVDILRTNGAIHSLPILLNKKLQNIVGNILTEIGDTSIDRKRCVQHVFDGLYRASEYLAEREKLDKVFGQGVMKKSNSFRSYADHGPIQLHLRSEWLKNNR